MNRKKIEILTDAIFEIAKREDKCGNSNCNRLHAIIGIWADKNLLHEAIELAKKKGFEDNENPI